MKIVLTGSLGHIGKPLAQTLVKAGHHLTVISHNLEKKKDIEALGAKAAIGSINDLPFLIKAFTGADLVYTMLPPGNFIDPELDLMTCYRTQCDNYLAAIRETGVKRIVHLSSIGADLEKGSGLLRFHYDAERSLDQLQDVSITFMRPAGFYYNLYGFVNMIKKEGYIATHFGEEDPVVWVSPIDIAAAVAEEILAAPVHRKVRYVASEELTCNETARILGEAIGKPDLKWKIISPEEMQKGLEASGIRPAIAKGLTEMYSGMHAGLVQADYFRNRPASLGKVKLKDFAKEFATVFA